MQWNVYAANGSGVAPVGITVDSVGKVYVVDSSGARVHRFTADGVPDGNWGTSAGSRGVGVDSAGFTYAFGSWASGTSLGSLPRILRFDTAGVLQATVFGYKSNEDGKLATPSDVALDSAGNVYVADSANGRIQKFDHNGNYLTKWTGLSTPYGIAIDDQDTVFVLEKGAARVQKRDVNGQSVGSPSQWDGSGTLPDSTNGRLSQPIGIEVAGDYVFVAEDGGNGRIQVFNKHTGSRVAYRTNTINGIRIAGIAVDSQPLDGSLATVYISVANISSSGTWKYAFGVDSLGNYQLTPLGTPWLVRGSKGLAVDNAHNVYISDLNNPSGIIRKYDKEGVLLSSWAAQGAGKGEITISQGYDIGVFVAQNGDVYTTDTSGLGRVQVFANIMPQVIAFDPATPGSKTYGDAAFDVAVTGGASGNPVVLGSNTPGVCTVSNNTVTLLAAGACTLTANQTGTANYEVAVQVTKNITVSKANQTVAFDSATPGSKTYGDAAFSVTATGGASGVAVIFGSNTPTLCTVSGNTVALLAAGTCTLTANQAGNNNYNAANEVIRDITVGEAANSGTGDGSASSGGGGSLGWLELLFAVTVLSRSLSFRSQGEVV